jgi:IS30 family transposase
MLSMLDRHAVQELFRAGVTARAIAKQYGVSRRTIERIRHEAPVTAAEIAEQLRRSRNRRLLLPWYERSRWRVVVMRRTRHPFTLHPVLRHAHSDSASLRSRRRCRPHRIA